MELQRKRAEDEVRALVEAGLTVLRQRGAAGLTVAEVLAEAGLSTRAFYRHFRSKDELVLAVYEQEAQRRNAEIAARIARRAEPRARLETWIDETLGLGFEPRRAAAHPGAARRRRAACKPTSPTSSRRSWPARSIRSIALLAAFPDAEPELDAWSIYAITWELVEAKLRGSAIDRATRAAQCSRFCLPALGLRP